MRNLKDEELDMHCLSDLTLDRLLTGELPPERVRTTELHLRGCEACSARRDAIKMVANAFFADPRSALTLARIKPPRTGSPASGRAWALVTIGIAATLGLAVLPARRDDDAVRTKGGLAFGFFVKRGERVFRGIDGEPVLPGDQLRFTVRPEREGYVAILSLDGNRVADVYYPASSETVPVRPGELETALATSVLLDETLGEEQIYALLCEQAPEVSTLRKSLALHRTLLAPVGCQMELMKLRKVRTIP